MSVKTGTKTWDDRPREANANRGSSGQTISADQKEKNFGGDDLGAILNKISDPNYVDESRIVRGVGNAKMDKDAFLKMMLAQLKNQDPTNPLKSHEMAAQMAQFSSVEQMANMNKSLEDIRDAQKSTHTYQVLDYLGKAVAGDSSKLIRVKNDLDHDVSFELPADATDVKIKVRNEQGDLVRSADIKNLKKGPQLWNWNGQNDQGLTQPAGEYSFHFEAKGKDGKKLPIKTDFEGIISGVNHTPEGPILMVGAQTIRLRDVRKIVDPALVVGAKKPTPPPIIDQKSQTPTSSPLKKIEKAPENEKKADSGIGPGGIPGVAMSKELVEKMLREVSGSSTGPGSSGTDRPAIEMTGAGAVKAPQT